MTAAARQQWQRENGRREPTALVEEFLSIDVNLKDFANRFTGARPIVAAVGKWTEEGKSQ